MDFLKQYNISDDDINIIINNNYESIINVVIYNKDNVCDVIDYLISIGIDNDTLSQLLSDRLDVFLKPVEVVSCAFEKFNVSNMVMIINDDIANMKFLDFRRE